MIFPFDNTYAQLPEHFFRAVDPTPVSAPSWIKLNHGLAESLGIDVTRLDSEEGLSILSGNKKAEGSEPIATAYSGHQFGGFSGQLGDGRAILLGEVVGKDGVRRDIQLKGSGPTPFSRRGDGRSALGPVVREYLVSEAMAALGVPTTRALAAIVSGDQVMRSTMEPGGVFTRVAQSHIRIGTFEFFASQRDTDGLRALADYAIQRHYPEIASVKNPYIALLNKVIERQAKLIPHWMQLGFIHGVMNTDNMTISGETIDYGPCAFLDEYHPEKKFSYIDEQGRYAFGNQAPIAHWNLTRFAETLLPLIDSDQDKAIAAAKESLNSFSDIYQPTLTNRILSKIGISEGSEKDWEMVQQLLSTMADHEADYTLTFRHLITSLEQGNDEPLLAQFKDSDAIESWLSDWKQRLENKEEATALMRRSNPVYIPRNHRIEQAIQAANKQDYDLFNRLNELLSNPFEEQESAEEFSAAPLPDEVVQNTFCGT